MPAAPEACSPCPPLGITTSSFIWALTIIAGVRLGRAESERSRLDLWRQVLSSFIESMYWSTTYDERLE